MQQLQLPVINQIDPFTPWFDMPDSNYVRPARTGYYELRERGSKNVERVWFNSATGNWMIVGGYAIWTLYDAWRGIAFGYPDDME